MTLGTPVLRVAHRPTGSYAPKPAATYNFVRPHYENVLGRVGTFGTKLGFERDLSATVDWARDAPDEFREFVALNVRKAGRLAREGRWGALFGYVVELATGRNPHLAAVRRRASGRFVERRVGDVSMLLDVADPGISRTLLAYGAHEQRSTDAFRRELRAVASEVEGPVTVLEIGANIGYYCLQELAALSHRAEVYALEPDPSNERLLRANVGLNGWDRSVDIASVAVGDRNGPSKLYMSARSNNHTMRPSSAEDERAPDGRESIRVEERRVEEFLDSKGVDPESVNVVRMDVDGYEPNVFEGMQRILDAPGPLLLFLELHPLDLDVEETDAVLSLLEEAGVEIRSVVQNEASLGVPDEMIWYGRSLDVDGFDELRSVIAERGYSVELVVRR